MRIFLGLFLFLAIFCSCSPRQSNKSSDTQDTLLVNNQKKDSISKIDVQRIMVDKAYIGMTISELKSSYPENNLKKEPVFKYDIEGGGDGILVSKEGTPQFFAWTMLDQDTIVGIEILSPSIVISNGVHVGMTFQDFLKIRPGSALSISEINTPYEYCYVEESSYSINFYTDDTNRVGKYTEAEDGYLYKGVARPESKIDRISVF